MRGRAVAERRRGPWCEDEDAVSPVPPYVQSGSMTAAAADDTLAREIVGRWVRREALADDHKIGIVLVLLPDPTMHEAVKMAAQQEALRTDTGELAAVGRWLKERVEQDSAARAFSGELYDDFVGWARRRNVLFAGGPRAFGGRLRRLGLRPWRDPRTGRRGRAGVRLRPVAGG